MAFNTKNDSDSDNLFKRTNNLISFLENEVKNNARIRTGESWDQPIIWKHIISHLDDIRKYYDQKDDEKGLAKVQVGLSKYLDFYSKEWMSLEAQNFLNHLIIPVVKLAHEILSSGIGGGITGCGNHEDSACVSGPLQPRFFTKTPLKFPGWPSLPVQDAVNFTSEPQHEVLEPGKTLYRIVGLRNTPYGNWWIPGSLPSDKKNWRSGCAVLTAWNSNGFYTGAVKNSV